MGQAKIYGSVVEEEEERVVEHTWELRRPVPLPSLSRMSSQLSHKYSFGEECRVKQAVMNGSKVYRELNIFRSFEL